MNSQRKITFQILPVVKKYLKTTIKGSNHWSICPFHADTTPSLSISEEKNIFKCFSCNVSGDAISFVMRIEKCSYVDAIRKIGEILGIDVKPHLNEKVNKTNLLHQLNEHVADSYHKYLFNNREDSQKALNYLTNTRKLNIETIKKYKIGYSPNEDILEPILEIYKQKNHLSQETIKESNLFIYLKNGTKIPHFRNRIIFPILNATGEVIGFSGRGNNPKYLNLKNNIAFSKNKAIFNIENLEEGKRIYLFEGFLDLMKANQELNIKNGIACMGGNISVDIFPIIKKYNNQVVLCLDNDQPGHNFTIDIGEKLLSSGFEVYVVDLLDQKEKDIDEIIDSKDKDIVKERMESPIHILDWIYKHQNPKNKQEIKSLTDKCLDLFLGTDRKPKSGINLSSAETWIEKIFGWYRLIPEYSQEIEEAIRYSIEKHLTIITQATISDTYISQEVKTKPSDPFIKTAIKYQQLISFMEDPSMKKWKEIFNEWKYEIPEQYLSNNPETQWLIKNLENWGEDKNTPEELLENHKDSLEIFEDDEFFNKYYSFYLEHLQNLGNNAISCMYDNLKDNFKKLENINIEKDKIKKISSNFFINHFLKRKHK